MRARDYIEMADAIMQTRTDVETAIILSQAARVLRDLADQAQPVVRYGKTTLYASGPKEGQKVPPKEDQPEYISLAPGISSQHLTSWLREFDLVCRRQDWQYPYQLQGQTGEAVRKLMQRYNDFRNRAEQEDEDGL